MKVKKKKRNHILMLCIFIVTSFVSFAQSIKQDQLGQQESTQPSLKRIEVRMTYLDEVPKDTVLLGTELNIKFELSEEIPIHFFQQLVNDKFLFGRAAYVTQAKSIVDLRRGFSKVFSAKAAFISPIVPKTDFKIKLEGIATELKIINLNIEVMNDPQFSQLKKPLIIDNDYKEVTDYSRYIFGGSVLFFCMLIIFIYFWLRFKEKRKASLYQEKWRHFILKANSRSELEKIYLLRRRWKDVLGIKASEVNLFSHVINKHQYKEEWGKAELDQVQKSLINIFRKSSKVEKRTKGSL